MKSIWKVVPTVGACILISAALAAPVSAAEPANTTGSPNHVVFVQNDNPAGNAIIAFDRGSGGRLSQAGTFSTGGRGGVLSGSVADHLASEGSLAYDRSDRLLIAVNAGSDTITTFAVRGDHLTRRQIISSDGEFPVSITVHDHLVYVLNARNGGSISGYVEVAGYLLPVRAWHRELHLNTSSEGMPNEFTSTPGQIGFAPGGSQLLVATKNGGNSVESFAVSIVGPSRVPVVNSLPGTVPFGFTFDRRGHLALTEAGTNSVVTFAVGRSGRLTAIDSLATGQAATCWIVHSDATLYASNAGSGTLSLAEVDAHGRLTDRGTKATDAGTVDAAVSVDGKNLYVQTGKAGLVDAYRIASDGSLRPIGSVTVPGGAGEKESSRCKPHPATTEGSPSNRWRALGGRIVTSRTSRDHCLEGRRRGQTPISLTSSNRRRIAHPWRWGWPR